MLSTEARDDLAENGATQGSVAPECGTHGMGVFGMEVVTIHSMLLYEDLDWLLESVAQAQLPMCWYGIFARPKEAERGARSRRSVEAISEL